MKMLEIDLPVPDHTTLSRRACGLPVYNPARIGTGELVKSDTPSNKSNNPSTPARKRFKRL
jgi:hypothetical protein